MTLRAKELKVGDTYEAVIVDNLTRTQLVQYAGSSGDYNPLHSDEVFATKVAGFPSVFAHGMLTMAMTGHMVTDYVGDGRLTRYGVRFVSQVWPGDTLTATATVAEIRDAEGEQLVELTLSTRNQNGEEVLSGYATARVD
jgi:acyl dehydratase